MNKNGILCVFPWTSLIFFGGKQGVRNCCWQNYQLDEYKRSKKIEDIWNGQKAQLIRSKMINGQIDGICPISCPMLTTGFTKIDNWFNDYEFRIKPLYEISTQYFRNIKISKLLKEKNK